MRFGDEVDRAVGVIERLAADRDDAIAELARLAAKPSNGLTADELAVVVRVVEWAHDVYPEDEDGADLSQNEHAILGEALRKLQDAERA